MTGVGISTTGSRGRERLDGPAERCRKKVVMAERFEVAIIGSGPGGLSAGARAAARGISHVVLERERRFAETIQKYQRGKLVMAAPDILPTRSDLSFAESSREQVLDAWAGQIETQRVNVRYGAEVTKI